MTTPNKLLKKYHHQIVVAGMIAGVILLLWILFRGCDDSPSHGRDIKEVKQDQQVIKQKDEQTQQLVTRLQAHADSLQRENVTLQAKLDVYEKEIAGSNEKTKRLTGELAKAKAEKDTVLFINTCDSLALLVQDKDLTIAGYMSLVDSVSENYQAQIDYKDSAYNAQVDLLSEFRRVNSKLETTVYDLNKDYNKLVRKHKRERTLSRVLAAGGIILGGLLLTK